MTAPDVVDKQRKRNTCTACRQSKVKCDRGQPCSRCSRLGLECIEQMRCQGRPVKITASSRKRSHAEMNKGKPISDTESCDENCQEETQSTDPVVQAVSKLSSFMTHTAADVMVARFSQLLSEGRLQRTKALAILRSWGLRSCRTGVDCSYGALGHMAKTMGVDLHHLQRPSTDASLKGQELIIEQVTVGSEALHPVLRGLDDGMSPFSFVICKNGNVGVYSNENFSELFLTNEEACHELKEKKILADYLWSRCFVPQCLAPFYEAVTNLNFGMLDQIGEIALVLMVRDRQGNEFPGLVRLRHIVYQDGEYSSTVISIIPMSSDSRALTNKAMPDVDSAVTDDEASSETSSTLPAKKQEKKKRMTKKNPVKGARKLKAQTGDLKLASDESQPILPPLPVPQFTVASPCIKLEEAVEECNKKPRVEISANSMGFDSCLTRELCDLSMMAYGDAPTPTTTNSSAASSPFLSSASITKTSSVEDFAILFPGDDVPSSGSSAGETSDAESMWDEVEGDMDLLGLAQLEGTTPAYEWMC